MTRTQAFMHYCAAFMACLFAYMWGYQVANQNAWAASLNVLLVGYWIREANRERVK